MQSKPILDLSRAPKDPVARVAYLDTVMAKAREEVEAALSEAYFSARLQRRFEDALRLGRASRKRALMLTRRHNAATGRAVRWNDGLDPSSTLYGDTVSKT